jgi:hypothetical protein
LLFNLPLIGLLIVCCSRNQSNKYITVSKTVCSSLTNQFIFCHIRRHHNSQNRKQSNQILAVLSIYKSWTNNKGYSIRLVQICGNIRITFAIQSIKIFQIPACAPNRRLYIQIRAAFANDISPKSWLGSRWSIIKSWSLHLGRSNIIIASRTAEIPIAQFLHLQTASAPESNNIYKIKRISSVKQHNTLFETPSHLKRVYTMLIHERLDWRTQRHLIIIITSH